MSVMNCDTHSSKQVGAGVEPCEVDRDKSLASIPVAQRDRAQSIRTRGSFPVINSHTLRLRASRFREQGKLNLAREFDQYAAIYERREAQENLRAYSRHLGENYHLAINAAAFMAACLRKKRLPRGAQRWMAQHALETWLPQMPPAERPPILATLKQCSERQIGRRLKAMVGA